MVSLNYEKTISAIMDGLVNYIYSLEELKDRYNEQLEEYNKLNSLYENMDYDLGKFVKEFAKSSKEKKKFFNEIANQVYEDNNQIKKLYNETRNNYLISIYSNNSDYQTLNDFKNKLKERIDSISLMLNENKLDEIENRIEKYIEFSNIFSKDNIILSYDLDEYIDIIQSLDIDSDIKINAVELLLIEFNNLQNVFSEDESIEIDNILLDDIVEENYLENLLYSGL